VPNLLVDDDRVLVIERERGREGVPVNSEAGDDQHRGAQPHTAFIRDYRLAIFDVNHESVRAFTIRDW
jgi:hypothetical protein